MASIRTVIVTMSPMLSDIIAALVTDHATIEVLAAFGNRAEAEKQLPVITPDLILVGLKGGEKDVIALSFLNIVPSAKVIAFSSDARNAYVHEMRAHRTQLTDVSPQGLIDAILETPSPEDIDPPTAPA